MAFSLYFCILFKEEVSHCAYSPLSLKIHKQQSPCSLIRRAHALSAPFSVGQGSPTKMLPVFWVIWRLVIICLHLGSINSLFLFCFKHCNMVLESASGQNLCKESKFYKNSYPNMAIDTICITHTSIKKLIPEAA